MGLCARGTRGAPPDDAWLSTGGAARGDLTHVRARGRAGTAWGGASSARAGFFNARSRQLIEVRQSPARPREPPAARAPRGRTDQAGSLALTSCARRAHRTSSRRVWMRTTAVSDDHLIRSARARARRCGCRRKACVWRKARLDYIYSIRLHCSRRLAFSCSADVSHATPPSAAAFKQHRQLFVPRFQPHPSRTARRQAPGAVPSRRGAAHPARSR